jgi:hypothetical protein
MLADRLGFQVLERAPLHRGHHAAEDLPFPDRGGQLRRLTLSLWKVNLYQIITVSRRWKK